MGPLLLSVSLQLLLMSTPSLLHVTAGQHLDHATTLSSVLESSTYR